MILAIVISALVWFIAAGVLFFNPFVDKIYRSEEKAPGVRSLPQSAKTIGMILLAIIIQVIAWAFVFSWVQSALPSDKLIRGLSFGFILVLTKILPRDIDRILLTTYPKKRMSIEFIIGIICAFVVGIVFGYLI